MKIDISKFSNKGTGYKEEYDWEGKVRFDDFRLSAPIRMRARLIKVEEGIEALIETLETKAGARCEKCLREFDMPIKVEEAERLFYFNKPEDYDKEADQADIFIVDKKENEIDLTEMLRQEILLHFPTSQVCSKSCKGLCPKCGVNLNEKNCGCKIDKNPDNPFKKLLK